MQTLQTACKCRRLPYMARLNAAVMPPKEMPMALFATVMGGSAIGIVAAVVMLVVLFV